MIHPKFWLRHWRVRPAVKNYPLYDVPHKQAERVLSEEAALENFQYFLSVRLERLAFFQTWLFRNFYVRATLDGDGVRAVSKWIDDFGGGLIAKEDGSTAEAFATYQPRWDGERAGYNVMIDIGIFLGEYLILKRPRLFWDVYRGHTEEPATFASRGYMRPQLGGMPRGWACDILTDVYFRVRTCQENARFKLDEVTDMDSSSIVRIVQSKLYCSKLPDGEGAIIMGDSRNEQL